MYCLPARPALGHRMPNTRRSHRPLGVPADTPESPTQLLARLLVLRKTAPYLPEAQQRSAGPTAPLPPLSSFRHGACYRVIALLINVSPSRDNSVIFTVRFFGLAKRDIQWCNLLSVHYALLGTPCGDSVIRCSSGHPFINGPFFSPPFSHRTPTMSTQKFFYRLQNIDCIRTVKAWAR